MNSTLTSCAILSFLIVAFVSSAYANDFCSSRYRNLTLEQQIVALKSVTFLDKGGFWWSYVRQNTNDVRGSSRDLDDSDEQEALSYAKAIPCTHGFPDVSPYLDCGETITQHQFGNEYYFENGIVLCDFVVRYSYDSSNEKETLTGEIHYIFTFDTTGKFKRLGVIADYNRKDKKTLFWHSERKAFTLR